MVDWHNALKYMDFDFLFEQQKDHREGNVRGSIDHLPKPNGGGTFYNRKRTIRETGAAKKNVNN